MNIRDQTISDFSNVISNFVDLLSYLRIMAERVDIPNTYNLYTFVIITFFYVFI